jgi:hypothetical protein
MKNDTRKWNESSLYSISFLFLSFASLYWLPDLLNLVDVLSIPVFRFNQFILKICNGDCFFDFYDLTYWVPITLGLVFLLTAFFTGIRSIKKTSGGSERGRMLGIISTTIGTFVMVLVVISYIIN